MTNPRTALLPARQGKALMNARQGTTAIEFALLAPALFLILFGAIEFGRLLWTQAALHFAVQEAARCASASQVTTYAANSAPPLTIPSSTFTSTTPSCGHQVSASFRYQFVVTG